MCSYFVILCIAYKRRIRLVDESYGPTEAILGRLYTICEVVVGDELSIILLIAIYMLYTYTRDNSLSSISL